MLRNYQATSSLVAWRSCHLAAYLPSCLATCLSSYLAIHGRRSERGQRVRRVEPHACTPPQVQRRVGGWLGSSTVHLGDPGYDLLRHTRESCSAPPNAAVQRAGAVSGAGRGHRGWEPSKCTVQVLSDVGRGGADILALQHKLAASTMREGAMT